MGSRPKRSNAGNRMAKLLNEEEEDDFYKTTYGGFDETEQDNDYKLVLQPFARIFILPKLMGHFFKLLFQTRSRS